MKKPDNAKKNHFLRITIGIVVLLFLFAAGSVGASSYEEWNKTFGGIGIDKAYSVQQTRDGGYILVGSRELTYEQKISGMQYESGIWFIKTDSKGNEQWNKIFKGAGSISEFENSVQKTSDGGYILAGYTNSSCGFGYCRSDAWLSKIDAKYNEQWNRTFRIIAEEVNRLNSVQQTSDGGYILAGGIGQGHLTKSIGWLIKTDANGNEQWNRTFGGKGWDWFNSVQETMDGGYILAGYMTRNWSGAWLVKTDANGNELWNRTFGAFGAIGSDWVSSVQQTSDGGYILASDSYLSIDLSRRDMWLIRTDAKGNELWNKTFGGIDEDEVYSVQKTSEGGYILSGITRSYGAGSEDAWLIKTDANGNELWNKTFGGTSWDKAFSIQQIRDSSYILAGITNSYGAGSSDAWLIKVSGESADQTEKIAGFEIILVTAILSAIYIFLRKRR